MKKYNKKVRLKQEIPGIGIIVGKNYEIDSLMKSYPFLDFNNTEYFEEVFDFEYKEGDKVRYVGSSHRLKEDKLYTILSVRPNIRSKYVYNYYTVELSDGGTYEVEEDDIKKVSTKWIISFSNSILNSLPAIHEINEISFDKKIKGTWKEIFVFDSYESALCCAELFKKRGDFFKLRMENEKENDK